VVESRFEVVKLYGADEAVIHRSLSLEWLLLSMRRKVAALMKEKFGLGNGADVVLESSGAESCIQLGIHVARSGGAFFQAGMARRTCYSLSLPFAHED
jgi:D-xylulose reductase